MIRFRNRPAEISIRHHIPGRIRLGIPVLGSRDARNSIMDFVENLQGVVWLRDNPACRSLIIGYDPGAATGTGLLDAVRGHLFGPGPGDDSSSQPEKIACEISECGCSGFQDGGLFWKAVRFAAASAVLGTVLFNRFVLGRAVLQTPLSPLGAAAAVLTLPLLRSGLSSLARGELSKDGFLAAGSLASVAAGEALTSLEILWIDSGAELLSAWIAGRSRKSIAGILDITSHHTFVLEEGVEVERRVEEVRPGDVVVLHTGEKICVDGVIVSGQALVDEAPLSGRPEPGFRQEKDRVHAGTFVHEGVLHVLAEQVGDKTYLARVMHKVQCSLEDRAPVEGAADRLASRLVKMGMGATLVTGLITLSPWRAFTVLLVMACPCATVLAASTAVSAAISAAARRGILIKGGRYLEEIGKCDVALFDKTGTLTTTHPVLQRVVTLNGVTEQDLLQLTCSAETHSHHPLALAIMQEAGARGISPQPHELCEYHLGMGMRSVVRGREVLVGNARLARMFHADPAGMGDEASDLKKQGLTVLYVFQDREPAGLLAFASRVRPEAEQVLSGLRRMGVKRLVMITGDEEASAAHLARSLGIEECYCGIMPRDKAAVVDRFRENGSRVLMVGDGINDALALARADVGVAVGTAGSEVAVEAADIALVRDDLKALEHVYDLSQQTIRTVQQNFWIATGSNVLGVFAGALGMLTPVTAGLVHVVHSLGVLANSSRLLKDATVKKPLLLTQESGAGELQSMGINKHGA